MGLLTEVRSSCAQIAADARYVRIDLDALGDLQGTLDLATPAPGLDPGCHYLEGEPGEVADYLLALDAINFGSAGSRCWRSVWSRDAR